MIVFSDMDGTFLTADKQVSERSRQALDALAERGIEFVPCTGRPLANIPREVLTHPSVHYAVSSNGAVVNRLDERDRSAEAAVVLRSVQLGKQLALEVWDRVARHHDVTFDIFADGHSYLKRDRYDRLERYVTEPHTRASIHSCRTPVDAQPEQTIGRVGTLERVAMYWHDPRDRDEILEELKGIEGIDVTRSYPMNIEVMAAGASKGASMAWLCDKVGAPMADVVAFGDNINDIDMLERAGLGVAVANAEPEVLAAADLVAATNDEDGVAEVVLERLLG